MTQKAALVSLGCDKNTVDSEIMLGLLRNANIDIISDLPQADIIIINTCGFLKDSVDEAREEVEAAFGFKRNGSCKVLVVTGCAAKRYREEFLALDGVDFVLGVSEYDKLIPTITGNIAECELPPLHSVRIPSTPKHYAYLRIAEGCDSHCTYCTIPKIRGAYTSRTMPSLLEEAQRLADFGVKELVLVAQDTTLYGKDIYGEQRLHVLLQELSQIDGIKWIRLLYCYPEHIYDELLAEIAKNPKVLPYIDLPIQHASDRILKLMNRKSSSKILMSIIKEIKRHVPDIVLRTTLITGFPSETKRDFARLCAFIEQAEFDSLGAFAYSREEGTAADKLPDHLPEKVKLNRQEQIMLKQQGISARKLRQNIGKIFEVVVEGIEESGVYFGRSYTQAPDIDGITYISSEQPLEIGDFVHVRITEAWQYDVMGEVCDEPAE
ncbi:MAG: 30S ribosomal protein S12 methylthiotransferase RimO [Defluviitaleaceae bacterium]|nr:30S ribosomal protein S12 methylthiotransferase RimO [Defluviitaleaceae bacterium]